MPGKKGGKPVKKKGPKKSILTDENRIPLDVASVTINTSVTPTTEHFVNPHHSYMWPDWSANAYGTIIIQAPGYTNV